MSVRVLIVDDQPLLRTGFRMILEAEPEIEVVGEAGDGQAAIQQVTRHSPDVVLMDIRMPVMDGIEATRRLAARGAESATRVLVLTTFDLDEYIVDALRFGASGFLLKDVPPEELVNAIRIIADGGALLAPTVTRRLLDAFAHRLPAPEVATQRAIAELTEREREVLVLIARGLTNAQIARRLFVSETTVKTHVSHVLMKLELRDRVQAVILAYEVGLVQPGDSPRPSDD
jgi:DNA-binding NarL/FixJ family response regulator